MKSLTTKDGLVGTFKCGALLTLKKSYYQFLLVLLALNNNVYLIEIINIKTSKRIYK